ncbi:MAG TPA: maleylpyruvate isomerase N-terminal domain-containing protein [Candidatus Limnocylindrales bacterium]|nr:maleylpyruvate isomerase N-terminal domain-containing protein [Candidatus Limnocylindrales bacterium]
MYLDALSLLDDERDAWRPFEALNDLTDDQLERPVEAANGWRGRDLMAHLVAWQNLALDVAKELAVNETSKIKALADEEWERRGGDVINDEILRDWGSRPLTDVREAFMNVGGELRGFLTVVPESRWIKDADNQRFMIDETLDHYEEHRKDLEAILASAAT